MVRVLIAEDSMTARELLVAALETDPSLNVVGVAKDGVEAVEMCKRHNPDVILMDINMPRMDGFEATKRIMIEKPTPIVIVSATTDVNQVEVSVRALSMGALAVIPKPQGPGGPRFDKDCRELAATVKAMSAVKVVRHWQERQPRAAGRAQATGGDAVPRIVAVAASTGGPAALQHVLSALPARFPLPVLVVQHITNGFVEGLASWLNRTSALRVEVARNETPILPSTVYIAPDDRHLGVAGQTRLQVAETPPVGGFRPSANHLFESAARGFGAGAVGVVLTGMGSDGRDGARAIRQRGGRVIVQDEASCVVFGMPARVIEAGLADDVLPLTAIPSRLIEMIEGIEVQT